MNIRVKELGKTFQLSYLNEIKISDDEYNTIGCIKYVDCDESFDNSFMVEDLKEFLKNNHSSDYEKIKIMVINNIFIDEEWRNKGIASTVLKSLCEEYSKENDPYIIMTSTYAHSDEYTGDEFDNCLDEILDKVGNFFKRCGFVNTNPVFGTYEFRESYIYVNEAAKKYIFDNDEYKRIYEENAPKIRPNKSQESNEGGNSNGQIC